LKLSTNKNVLLYRAKFVNLIRSPATGGTLLLKQLKSLARYFFAKGPAQSHSFGAGPGLGMDSPLDNFKKKTP
jgi:hypothetical protein